MNKPSPNELADTLHPAKDAHRHRVRLAVASGLALIAIVAVFAWRHSVATRPPPSPFVTEPLTRGDISLTITATGNLEPTNEVTVGSELSGTILEVYVDTNDRVTKGQPLAKLDTTKLEQEIASSRASLASAQAQVTQARSTVKETAATLARQQALRKLSDNQLPSQSDLDATIAAADRAQANLLVAQAAVGQAQAQLDINETDLTKAVIKSPIDGIVLTRDIEPGQTVAASFSAPELFVIAEKLEHMKLTVAVAEADIGRVAKDQPATFTVDAWPTRAYDASVLKVSYGSEVTDNVVTYDTELQVANADLSLRPGMTATADIRVAQSEDVFLVPSSALRFTPAAVSADATQKKSFVQSLMPMPPRMNRASGKTAETEKAAPGTARVWVLKDGEPQPVQVSIGLADERHTEISAPGLAAGMQVILRSTTPSSSR